jgi:hypothetical protein
MATSIKLSKFIRLVKVDEAKRQAWGLATAEVPDKSGEICDYDAAKSAYQKWSQEAKDATTKSGQEVSLGNVRLQHTLQPVGKVIEIDYRDEEKEIFVGTYIDDDDTWRQIQKGILTGFSHGGEYAWRKCNDCGTDMLGLGNVCPECEKRVESRYAPVLAELSVVDNPCLERAHFDYVKADGSRESRSFVDASLAGSQGAPFDSRGVRESCGTRKSVGRSLSRQSVSPTRYGQPQAESSPNNRGRSGDPGSNGVSKAVKTASVLPKHSTPPTPSVGVAARSNGAPFYAAKFGSHRSSFKLAARTAENKGGISMSTEAKEIVRAAKKTIEDHFSKTAAHHQQMAKCHAELSQAHDETAEKIAKCLDKGKGDDQVNQALYDCHKCAAEQHERIAQEHEDHAEKCGKIAQAQDNDEEMDDEEKNNKSGDQEQDDEDAQVEKALLASLLKARRSSRKESSLESLASQWMVKMFQQSLENAAQDKEINEVFARLAVAKGAAGSIPRSSAVKTFVPRGGEVQTIRIEAEEISECGL